MSYGSAPAPPIRRGGGGTIFFIILAIGAFLLFSNRNVQQPDDASPTGNGHSPEEVLGSRDYEQEQFEKEILGGGGDFEGRPMPSGQNASSGDWQMDDVATKRDSASTQSKAPSKTTNGDWSIEDVDNKKQDPQFKFSQQTPANKTETKTGGGDWSIEDAGTKKENKKTESGDWAIEETNSSKNDK